MTLTELKQAVDHAVEHAHNPESITVRILTFKTGSAGHIPCTDVRSAHVGIDWEAKSFLIHPVNTLREIDRDEVKTLQDKYEELGWSLYKVGKVKRENEQLKQKLAAIVASKLEN
jgi:hypothetical protein